MNAFRTELQHVHGGPDRLGVPLHDFSSNSNACGPCPQALAAVQGADASRYPDASYSNLRAQLAAFHGVDVWRIVLATSASEFVFRITALAARQGLQQGPERGAPGSVWLPPHGYSDYGVAAQAHGLAVAADASQASLRWLCEPSSPLGAAQESFPVPAAGAYRLTVLDRAYEPLRLTGTPSLTDAQLQSLWQLWTPNKALGLTGVRAAYAVAPLGAQGDARVMEMLCPSWPIGAHGVAMLQAWTQTEVQAWLAASLGLLRGWKARQISLCAALGWNALPGDANFFVCDIGIEMCALNSDRAVDVFSVRDAFESRSAVTKLRSHGIKLRDCASFGLPGHVRLSVQMPAAQDELLKAWQCITKADA